MPKNPELKTDTYYLQENPKIRFEVAIPHTASQLVDQVLYVEGLTVGQAGALRYVAEYPFQVANGFKPEEINEIVSYFKLSAQSYVINVSEEINLHSIVQRMVQIEDNNKEVFIPLSQNEQWRIGIGRNMYPKRGQDPNYSRIGIYVQEIATQADIDRVEKELEESINQFVEFVVEGATETNPYRIDLGINANQPNSRNQLMKKAWAVCSIFGVSEVDFLNNIPTELAAMESQIELVTTDLWKIAVVKDFDANQNPVYYCAISPGPRIEV